MSFTERGTLMVLPFLPSSFWVLSDVAAEVVFSTTSSATSWPLATAFCVAFLADSVAFLAPLVALELAFFALDAAFEPAFLTFDLVAAPAFFAVDFTEEAAFAADKTLVATEAESPAFCKSFALALAIFATVVNLASTNFLAVAAPTPGIEAISADVSFLPMVPRQFSASALY